MAYEKIFFLASETPEAQEALRTLEATYNSVPVSQADVIVAIGGDGFMLQSLHNHMEEKIPVYGMNLGSLGFLMNDYRTKNLLERINGAELLTLHPLRMRVKNGSGVRLEALAINEVSLLRSSRQAAKIRIIVDGKVRLEELVCDGVLIATPAGSSAYNLSVQGPIIPLSSDILALTPISAFRPRRWRGALLPHNAKVRFEILESDKRPVSAVADTTEAANVKEVEVEEDRDVSLLLLFDPEHNLAERIIAEQFVP